MNPIYLEEKIKHSLLVVYLYVLRLPTQPSEITQFKEIISNKKIKKIFYSGTQPISIQMDQIQNITIQEGTQMKDIVEYIHEELISNQSNVGLMCSQTCDTSLKIYFHYMVMIEKIKFNELPHDLFKHVFSIEQLQQCYNSIKKNDNITILDYDSCSAKSIIFSNIGSDILKREKPISEIKAPQIHNNHRIFNGYQKDDPNYLSDRSKMILGKDDQVMSEFYQSDISIPPFISLLEASIQAESKARSIKNIEINNYPQSQKEYKLPKSIQFLHFTTKEGFKCLQ